MGVMAGGAAALAGVAYFMSRPAAEVTKAADQGKYSTDAPEARSRATQDKPMGVKAQEAIANKEDLTKRALASDIPQEAPSSTEGRR